MTVLIDGIAYHDDSLEFYEQGRVREGTLAAPATVHGLPCASERDVVYRQDGSLVFATLAASMNIAAVPCDASSVCLHDNGRVANCTLARAYADREGIRVSAKSRITLDATGSVLEYSTTLEVDQTLQGLPCSALFGVWRYPSGQLSHCVLSEPHAIDGTPYPQWTELTLERDGSVLDMVVLQVEPGCVYKRRIHGAVPVRWQ